MRHQLVLDSLIHPALVHALLEGLVQIILMPLGGRDRAGVHQGGMALSREDLGDAAAHRTGAEDSYFHLNSS